LPVFNAKSTPPTPSTDSGEKVKKFALTPDVWSIAAGHVTPTLKLRRKPILQMYAGLYEGLYEEASN